LEVSSLFFLVLLVAADAAAFGGAEDVTVESRVRFPVADAEVVLRKVFRSGLANWSAQLGVVSESPSLLPPDEDMESTDTLARGRGLGLLDRGAWLGVVAAGRSRTRSGVCFCFCWMEVRWVQKSRLERNPPRRLPMLSEAETTIGVVVFVLASQRVLFLLKPALVSPWPELFTCSLDAQLDCLSMIGGALFEVSVTDDLGAGSGGA